MTSLSQKSNRLALPERLWLLNQVACHLNGTNTDGNPSDETAVTEWLDARVAACRLIEHADLRDTSGNHCVVVATLNTVPKTLTTWLTDCFGMSGQMGELVPQQLRQLLGRVLEAEQSQQPIQLTSLSCELGRLLKTYWPALSDKDYRNAIELALTTELITSTPLPSTSSRRGSQLCLLGIAFGLSVIGWIAWRIVLAK